MKLVKVPKEIERLYNAVLSRQEDSMVELGTTRKDSVTGFQGKVTCVARYVSGPVRILLEGIDTQGRPVEYWCDEDRLAVKATRKK